jgi:hypothetical protein
VGFVVVVGWMGCGGGEEGAVAAGYKLTLNGSYSYVQNKFFFCVLNFHFDICYTEDSSS